MIVRYLRSTQKGSTHMKKVLSAASAALVAAVVVSVAIASTSVKVTSHHTKWIISGTAPAAAGGNVVDEEIIHRGKSVASDNRYTAPTAANGYKWKVVAKKSELPAGR